MSGRRETEGLELARCSPVDEIRPLALEGAVGPAAALAPLDGGGPEVQVHVVADAARRCELCPAVESADLEGDDRPGRPGGGHLRLVKLRAAARVGEAAEGVAGLAGARPPEPVGG